MLRMAANALVVILVAGATALVGACAASPSAGGAVGGKAASPSGLEARSAPEPAPLSPKMKLSIALVSLTGSSWALYAAVDGGFLDKYGIDVDTPLIQSSTTAIKALVAGDVPLIFISGEQVVSSNLAGADAVMLTMSYDVPNQFLIVRPEIQKPEDLKGKAVVVSRFGSTSDFFARYSLGQLSLVPEADVAVLQIGEQSARRAALDQGTAHGASMSPPESDRAIQAGYKIMVDVAKTGLKFPNVGLVSTRGWARDNPEIVRRVVWAIVEGTHMLKTDKARAIDILRKRTGIDDPEILEQSYQFYVVERFKEIPYPSDASFQTALDIRALEEPRAKELRPQDFYDPSLLREVERSGAIQKLYGK